MYVARYKGVAVANGKSEEMSSFGEKIKELRKSKGWSQEEFAAKIGIHGRHVGKYENGKVLPNAETLIKIAEVFEVSTDYLLFEGRNSVSPASSISDRDLLEKFARISEMDPRDQEIVKELIDAFIKKRQIEELVGNKA